MAEKPNRVEIENAHNYTQDQEFSYVTSQTKSLNGTVLIADCGLRIFSAHPDTCAKGKPGVRRTTNR